MIIPVIRLMCALGSGSGVVVGPDQILTAEHFAKDAGCPHSVIASNRERDFAVLRAEQSIGVTPTSISCDGVIPGQSYLYRGQYTRGRATVAPRPYRLGYSGGLRLLIDAKARSGDSGGGVFNDAGQVIGVIIGHTETGVLVRDLANTELCND